MSDHFITASVSGVSGAAVVAQTAVMGFTFSEAAVVTVLAMIATALVSWGMFRKATEHNEKEISLLRAELATMNSTLTQVQVQVARIEGAITANTNLAAQHRRDDGYRDRDDGF